MTLIFLDASLGIFGMADPFCDPDFLLPQLQPVLASLAPYFLKRDRFQPCVIRLRLLRRKAWL
jgi:hypothetical protein